MTRQIEKVCYDLARPHHSDEWPKILKGESMPYEEDEIDFGVGSRESRDLPDDLADALMCRSVEAPASLFEGLIWPTCWVRTTMKGKQ